MERAFVLFEKNIFDQDLCRYQALLFSSCKIKCTVEKYLHEILTALSR